MHARLVVRGVMTTSRLEHTQTLCACTSDILLQRCTNKTMAKANTKIDTPNHTSLLLTVGLQHIYILMERLYKLIRVISKNTAQ